MHTPLTGTPRQTLSNRWPSANRFIMLLVVGLLATVWLMAAPKAHANASQLYLAGGQPNLTITSPTDLHLLPGQSPQPLRIRLEADGQLTHIPAALADLLQLSLPDTETAPADSDNALSLKLLNLSNPSDLSALGLQELHVRVNDQLTVLASDSFAEAATYAELVEALNSELSNLALEALVGGIFDDNDVSEDYANSLMDMEFSLGGSFTATNTSGETLTGTEIILTAADGDQLEVADMGTVLMAAMGIDIRVDFQPYQAEAGAYAHHYRPARDVVSIEQSAAPGRHLADLPLNGQGQTPIIDANGETYRLQVDPDTQAVTRQSASPLDLPPFNPSAPHQWYLSDSAETLQVEGEIALHVLPGQQYGELEIDLRGEHARLTDMAPALASNARFHLPEHAYQYAFDDNTGQVSIRRDTGEQVLALPLDAQGQTPWVRVGGNDFTQIEIDPQTLALVEESLPGGELSEVSVLYGQVHHSLNHAAEVHVFNVADGEQLGTGIADVDGLYSVTLKQQASDYYVVANLVDGVQGDVYGQYESFCPASPCDVTPLTTLAVRYGDLLTSGTLLQRWDLAREELGQALGLTPDQFLLITPQELQGVVDLVALLQQMSTDGIGETLSGIASDATNGYLDDDDFKPFFPRLRERPVTQARDVARVPAVGDPDSIDTEAEVVYVHEGGSRDFLIDMAVQRPVVRYEEDGSESLVQEQVLLGFNVDRWAGRIDYETTVMADIFSGDINLAVMPREEQKDIAVTLAEEYADTFEHAVDLLPGKIAYGGARVALYEQYIRELRTEAVALLGGSRELGISTLSARAGVTLPDQSGAVLNSSALPITAQVMAEQAKSDDNDKKSDDAHEVNSWISLSYEDDGNLKVNNGLPIHFGVSPRDNDLNPLQQFLRPLIDPAPGGVLSMSARQLPLTDILMKWTKQDFKSTKIPGTTWDPSLFNEGEFFKNQQRDYVIHKNLSRVDLPAVMNVAQGVSYLVELVAGIKLGAKAFEDIGAGLENTSKKAKRIVEFAEIVEFMLDMTAVLYFDLNQKVVDGIEDDEIRGELSKHIQNSQRFGQHVKNLRDDLKAAIAPVKSFLAVLPTTQLADQDQMFNRGQVLLKAGGHNWSLGYAKGNNLIDHLHREYKFTFQDILWSVTVPEIMYDMLSTLLGSNLEDLEKFKDFEKNFKENYNITVIQAFQIRAASHLAFGKKDDQKIPLVGVVQSSLYTTIDGRGKYNEALGEIHSEMLKKLAGVGNGKLSDGYSLYSAYLKKLTKNLNNMKRVLKAVSDLKADEIGADDIGDGLATVGAVLTNYLKNSATDAIKNIRKIALQAVAELPHYFMGTKAAKIALVANKFAGLATAQFLTPDEIPFSIEVDENGELDFTYPRLSVIGAESSLIPLGEEDTKSIFTGNLTAGQNVNRVHPFVVSDQKEPPLYLPRYRLYFEHSKRELKDQIFDAAEWRGDVAVNLVLNLGRYEDEFVSGEPALFGGSENRVIKGFKPSDLARHIKEDSDEISSIELINVLGESNKSWWEFLSDDFNLGSVSVVNKTRGIFRESFGYDIFEPIGGRLENRATRFDLDHRYVFKTASLRDLRPGLALISERHDDGSYDLIVYNKSVGHNVTVLILDDEIDPTVLQSYLLKPRESLRFDPLQHENSTFLIFDHVVSGYSEFLDHGNVLQTLHAMAGLKELSFEKFLGEYGKFVGEATSNIPLDPHHFILRASSASHFDDPAENGGIEVSSDWLQSITEETHAFLRVNDNDRAGYYFAPVSQHAVKWLDDDYLVLNRVSSPLIQTTDLQTEQIRNTLVGKYGALDLHLQGITPWQDDDGQVIGITDNRGNRYRLLTYNERTDGKIEIRLQPEMDKNRLFECKSAWMSCAPLSWIDNFSYDLLITDAEIYSDSDGDAIINELDAFPDDERWHADTSGDGLPDQFIRNLRLDINNRYAELDLNGDGDTVMDAFLNDGHPLMLATPWLQLELAPGDGAVIARWEPVEPGIGSVERYDLSYKKIDEVVGLGNTLEDVTSPHRLEGLETGERYRVRLDIVTSEGFTLFTEEPLYFGPTGSLQVTLRPDEAVAAGAQWRRANTYSWFDSEQTETNIPIGAQTVEFKDIGDDWEVPSDATVSISVGETTPLTGRYTPVDDDDPTPPTATYPLNDTGIDWCADGNTNNLDCSDTAFDFPGQDGEYGRDALAREGRLDKVGAGHAGFDFTKLDANGDPLSIQDAAWSDDGREIDGTRWSCVRDNHTGLIWEVKTDDDGLRDKDHEYTWYNPETNGGRAGTQDGGSCNQSDCDTHAYVQAVNEQGLCGAKDWRLPSVDELLSIVSNDRTDPAIDTNYFPNARSSRFWSSSPVASASNGAWVVHFDHGSVYNDGYVNGDLPVRLVRAGQ